MAPAEQASGENTDNITEENRIPNLQQLLSRMLSVQHINTIGTVIITGDS